MYPEETSVRVRPNPALAGLSEAEALLATTRLRCAGAAKAIVERCKPCRCSGQWKQSYLWHNYRPMGDKMEEIMLSLVRGMREAPTIVVTATACIMKFLDNEGTPMCKDQFLRMISVAVCVNAKFWDDEQAGKTQNERIAAAHSIPLDEFNTMEIAFMRGCGWNLHISEEDFEEWVEVLELGPEARKPLPLRRNPSPHSSTDLVEGIDGMLTGFGVVSLCTKVEDGRGLSRVENGVTA